MDEKCKCCKSEVEISFNHCNFRFELTDAEDVNFKAKKCLNPDCGYLEVNEDC